jgi:DNA-binding transcriptional ArsR family regulator
MRLVDLRSSAPAPTLEVLVQASAAAELLRLIGVLSSDDPREYDVGQERLERIQRSLPEDLAADIAALRITGDGKDFLILSLLAATLPDPGGVDELVTALRHDPAMSWRMLVAHETQRFDTDPGLGTRLMDGDPHAFEQLRALVETSDEGSAERLAEMLTADPEEHGRRLADVVERFDQVVWSDLEDEAMAPIRRDVEHRNERLAAGIDPATVIVEATNGYEPPDDPALRRVVLLPSYWMRPWLVVGQHGADLEVISTVVADEFLVLPSEAPPPALLKLAKALSDESRLRLLRRMASGPISLSEATAALDVTKATAHHHLSILRQAGLVSMRGTGRATRYALRHDPADAARDALASYCCRP